MKLRLLIVKLILTVLVARRRRAFLRACANPSAAQARLKERLLAEGLIPFPLKATDHSFYQNLPKLTRTPPVFFETTSGSTGAKKQIPYTRSLLRSFESMFLLWAHDVLCHSGIRFRTGRIFVSISPQIGAAATDDRRYLSRGVNLLLTPFLASDVSRHKAQTGDEFLLRISADLVRSRDLEVISIWSPSYLVSLLDFMDAHKAELGLASVDPATLWPDLKLISCWTHGQAERPAELLREKFPNVVIQPKGLLLTEAPVTIPWTAAGGCVPFVSETLVEFLDEEEQFVPLEGLERGRTYRVVISAGNGYLRYDTGDLVTVTGRYKRVPVLTFVGRAGCTVDMAGEKFSDLLLRKVLRDVQEEVIVIPELVAGRARYVLLCGPDSTTDWDRKLSAIYHYRFARELGQLKAPRLVAVPKPGDAYVRFCVENGMVLGDIKERILVNDLTQAQRFLEWLARDYPPSAQAEAARGVPSA
jgi:hypothetical protein